MFGSAAQADAKLRTLRTVQCRIRMELPPLTWMASPRPFSNVIPAKVTFFAFSMLSSGALRVEMMMRVFSIGAGGQK